MIVHLNQEIDIWINYVFCVIIKPKKQRSSSIYQSYIRVELSYLIDNYILITENWINSGIIIKKSLDL